MKYAVGMGSGDMMYMPSFRKIGSAIRKLIGRDSETHRQHGDIISLHLFLQNKESILNIKNRSS
jgi:hypothetical protein